LHDQAQGDPVVPPTHQRTNFRALLKIRGS
jgi:hypothetical protein